MKSRRLLAKLCLVTFSIANIPSASTGMINDAEENNSSQRSIVPVSEINSNSIKLDDMLKKHLIVYLEDQKDASMGVLSAFLVSRIYCMIYEIICNFLCLCNPSLSKHLPSPKEEEDRIYKKLIGTWECYCNFSQIKENWIYAENKAQSEVSAIKQIFNFIYHFLTSDLWNGCTCITYVLDGVEYVVGSDDLKETIEIIKSTFLPLMSVHLRAAHPLD